ncbi:MAG TPA: class I SAM-dependent methyltransferase [Actinomycetota bacterium]|nr:class I SAM-dependent methyltransferase [Actinomycetota bacterium]
MATSTDELTERIFGSLIATGEILTVYLGDRLGLYAALAEGAATSDELARRAGVAERYAREWLEQQTTAGFLDVDDVDAAASERRYSLPPEHAKVLLHQDELTYLPPIARVFVAAAQRLPELMLAYRDGGGVGWREFGPDMSEGQEYGNRPAYLASMADWIEEGIADVHERLGAGGRVADVGCGGGWSSIAIAKAYPGVTVDGFDLDEPAIERARRSAQREGVADRVRFHATDPAELDHGDGYALVTAFECIHDMPHPVPVLAAMRSMAGADGAVVVMDENVAPAFGAIGDETERLMYTFSTLVCLADGMSHPNSVGTGTVMRPDVLDGYARDAGFSRTEILPIDGGLWRFYRLHP